MSDTSGSASPSSRYPFYRAAGDPLQLGRQHGEQARAQIHAHLDYVARQLKLTRESLRRRALKFLPLFERHVPHLLPELHGLAEGAGIEFADALVPQLRGELAHVSEEGCTSFAIRGEGTYNGEPLIGQTSDNPPELMDFAYVLRLEPTDGPRMLMWTFGGMIGYHGLNQYGVAHFANSLGGGPCWRFALSHYPLKRRILEQRTVAAVLQLMHEFPVCSNGNYMLGDGKGEILDVELTADGPVPLSDHGAGFLVHANHYLCSPHACEENFVHSLPDSFGRQERFESLIGEKFGNIRLADLQQFTADHDGFPTGICRHSHDADLAVKGPSMLDHRGCTVAALIAEPLQGLLHVTRGNPCECKFVTYSLHD